MTTEKNNTFPVGKATVLLSPSLTRSQREPQIQFHKWLRDDTIKIKLEKGQKNTYAWEITYEDKSTNKAIAKIKEADEKLRAVFQEEKDENRIL